jgi:iron complex outermembrane receptor protein
MLVAGVVDAWARQPQDLRGLSLEQLGNIEVTTVSRIPDTVTRTPAAVFIITRDDIRRSGARSIPEALRLAPGVQVARIDSSRWAIGIRGFADRLARSILVRIDGRAVYSSLFAGTYWEVQDTLLEDVDRIEVIRGPGGTLWGANAINGIINIITRAASDTPGVLVTGQAGTSDFGSAGFRFGGAAGDLSYRAYGKVLNRGPEFHDNGDEYDSWLSEQGGFRADWLLSSGRTLTVQGDAYHARSGQRATLPTLTSPFTQTRTYDASLSGGNVVARWASPATARSAFSLQAYFDHTNRDEEPVGERRDTFDLDFQQRLTRSPRQDFVWGLGHRVTSGHITAVSPFQFVPETRTDNLSTAFAHVEIAVLPDRLRVSGGAKIEHNSYTGFEIQPSGQLAWTVTPSQTVVASITRAVRTPSRVETDYTAASFVRIDSNTGLPIFVGLSPNPEFDSEKLVAYEAGYRIQPNARTYVTASAFYNVLNDVLSTEPATPVVQTTPPPPRAILPVFFANGLHGSSAGVEATADVRPATWWRVTANYSYLRIELARNPGSADLTQERTNEGRSPRHQWQAMSSMDLPGEWSFDASMRYISELPIVTVPAYASSTLRLAWKPSPRAEVAVVGADLNAPRHLEWLDGVTSRNEIRRSVYASVTFTR